MKCFFTKNKYIENFVLLFELYNFKLSNNKLLNIS